MFYNKNNGETKQRFGIRKLTIGTCSVLLSTLFLTMGINQTVHADTIDANANNSVATEEVANRNQASDGEKNDSNNEDEATESTGQSSDDSAAVSDAQKTVDKEIKATTSDNAGGNGSEGKGANGEDGTSSENENTNQNVVKVTTDDHVNSANKQNNENASDDNEEDSADKDKNDTVSVADLATANPNTVGESKAAANNTNDTTTTEGITHNADGSTTYTPVLNSQTNQYVAPQGTPSDVELIKNVTVTFEVDAPEADKTDLGLQSSYPVTKNLRRTATVNADGSITYGGWYLAGAVVNGQIQGDYKINDQDNYNYLVTNKVIPANGQYKYEITYTDGSTGTPPGTFEPNYSNTEARYREQNVYVKDLRDVTVKIMWQNTQKYEFVDADENDKVVPVNGEDTFATVSGYITQNADQQVTLPTIPENYELVEGQTLPGGTAVTSDLIGKETTVQVTGASTVQIKLKHATKTYTNNVNSETYDATPEAGTPADIAANMIKNVEVGIVVEGAPPINGQDINKHYTFTKHFYRDATVDLVTGDVTYGVWNLDGALDRDGNIMGTQHYAENETTSYYFPFSDTDTLPTEIPGYTRIVSNFETTPADYSWGNGTIKHEISPYGNQQAFKIFDTTVGSLPTKVIETITWVKSSEARTATVNYVYGTDVKNANGNIIHHKGDQMQDANGNAIAPAELDVAYTRTVTQDADGNIVTGDWTVDTNNTNGYTVQNGMVVANVPTVAGYTAWTNDGSNIPTNEFDAATLENGATKTVWYLPAEEQTRTITENFKKVDTDGNVTGDATTPWKANVYYQKNILSYDSETGTVTYADNWSVDTSKGTNGVEVISGNGWNLPTDATSQWSITPPTIDGYTAVTQAVDESFDTSVLNNPNTDVNNIFTNSDSTTALPSRNNITTYYVPNSALEKKVTRVVNQYYDDNSSLDHSFTDTVTFTRSARVNTDDRSITFGGNPNLVGGTWTAGEWDFTSETSWNPVNWDAPDYVAVANGQVVTSIPANDDVTPDTPNETIDVYHYRKKADLGINHAQVTQIYNGSAATIPSDIVYQITNINKPEYVTLPSGVNNVQLNTSDFSFTDEDGKEISAPTNAGTYHIILNSNGLKKFNDLDKDFTFNYDPTTSYVTYVIDPANVTVTLVGSGSKTYDREAVTTADLNNAGIKASYTFNGQTLTLDLQDGNYNWDGGSAPINGRTEPYTLTLSQDAIQEALNEKYGIGQNKENNVNVTVAGSATYTINPATKATTVKYVDASGNVIASKQLTGEVSDPVGTVVDVNYQDGVPENWEITPGQTIPDQINIRLDGFRDLVNGTTSDTLNNYDDGIIIKIQHKTVEYTSDSENIPDGVDVTKDVTRTINITTPVVQTDSTGTNTGQVTYKKTTDTQTTTFTRAATYDLVDKKVISYTDWAQKGSNSWTAYPVPTVTGYTPVIKIDGQTATSIPTVDVTATTPNSTVNVTYAENIADVTISGGPFTKVYNGEPATIPDGIVVTITIPEGSGITSLPQAVIDAKNSLSADDPNYPDFIFANSDLSASLNTNPTDVGDYKIVLSDKAIEKLNDAAKSAGITIHFNYSNSSNVDYSITPQELTAGLQGTQRVTYSGQPVTSISTDDIYVKTNVDNLTYTDLQPGDYKFYQNGQEVTPVNAGEYQVKLTGTGITKIQNAEASNKNYTWTIDPNSVGTLIIEKDTIPKVTISGDASKPYDGTPIAGYVPTVEITNAPGVNPVTLTQGDYEFHKEGTENTDWTTTAPSDVGKYQVRLTQAGLNKITSQNTENIDWFSVINAITPPTGTYTIDPTNIALNLQNSGSKIYNGQAVEAGLTTGEDGNVVISGKPEHGAEIDLSQLNADDFVWTDADGNQVTNPTNVGTYTLTLTDQALTDLANTNPNYTFTTNGSYTYTITPATVTVTISKGQSMPWTGSQVAIDPSKYGLAITTDNGVTLTPDVTWDADDFQIDGSSTIPTDVGKYTVTLSDAGLTKLTNAINNSNYNVVQAGTGSYDITKAQTTIKLSGSDSVVYTGNPAVLPVDANGDVTGITVTLSNGLTYNLKPGDLDFVETDHTNVGTYYLVLSDRGIANINAEDKGDNYDYTYDKSQATLKVTPAEASYQLTGSQSDPYKGTAYTASDLVSTNYQVKFTAATGETLTYTLQAGDLAFATGDPTNYGKYNVVLTQAGQDHIKAISGNYTFTALDPTATFDISAQEMHVNITGTASSIYEHKSDSWADGTAQGVPSDQLSQIHLTWGGQNIKPTGVTGIDLTTDDFVYYEKGTDGNWQQITTNSGLPVNPGTYGLRLTNAAVERLNKANSNYTFTNGDQVSATFIINKRIATVTLTGSQSAAYTENGPLDLSNYTITVVDTTHPSENPDKVVIGASDSHHLVDGDIAIVTNGAQHNADGLPVNVGTYGVEMQEQLIDRLKGLFKGYNFEGNEDASSNDGYVFAGQNNNASYIITPLEAYATLSGTQSIKYSDSDTLIPRDFTLTLKDKNGNAVKNVDGTEAKVELTADNLKINTDLTGNLPVGQYNVVLSKDGLNKIKNIGYIDADNSNYSWTFVQSAKLDVAAMPITINLTGSASSVFGNPVDLDSNLGKYSYTLTNDNNETVTTTYALQDGDLEFINGVPSGTGSDFKVQLSQAGVEHILASLNGDTSNYTLDKQASEATYSVIKATPTVTITGSDGKTYDGQAATITPNKYEVKITFDSALAPLYLDGSSLQFANGVPTAAGDYKVGLTQAAIDHLNKTYPNIDWGKVNFNNISADYKINQAQASAVLSGSNNKTYNGSAITLDDINSADGTIKVVISVNGIDKTINYKLQAGDYTWNTNGNQAPVNAGSYTLSLNKDSIVNNLQAVIDADPTWKGNVIISANDLRGTADFVIDKANVDVTLSGTQTATYNAQEQAITPDSFTIALLTNNGQHLSCELKDGDLQYATSGDHINVNDYAVELSAAGKNNIAADTDNYNYNFNGTGYVDVTKKTIPAEAITFANNTAEKTYDGQRIADFQPTVNIVNHDAYGIYSPAIKLNNGVTGDYIFVKKNADGTTTTYVTNPYSAGTYDVKLTQAGINWLKSINSENLDWSQVNLQAGQSIGTYIIDPAQATAKLSGEITVTYNGSQVSTHEINITDSTNPIRVRVTVNLGNNTSLTPEYQLDDSDYVWTTPADGVAPKDVGTYTIELNAGQASDKAALLAAIEKELNKMTLPTSANGTQQASIAGNYDLSIDPGSATINIVKKPVTLTQTGSGTKVYDGQPVSTVPSLLSEGFVPDDTLDHNLPASDFDWYEGDTKLAGPPTDVGDYTAKLSQAGLDYLNDTYPNYTFKMPTGEFTYSITQATATATLSGSGTKVYNAQPVTTAEVNGQDGATSDIKVTVNVLGKDSTYTLQSGDYTWNTTDGNAPTDAGNYSIELTDQGIQNIEKEYGNQNIKWTNDQGESTITGSADYEIQKATGKITFTATDQTKQFNNQSISSDSIDPITVNVNGVTRDLAADEYQIVDSQGNPVTDTKNAGTYYIALTHKALMAFENNDNYTDWDIKFNGNAVTNQLATYEVTPITVDAQLSGSNSKAYDGQAISTADINKGGNISVSASYNFSGNNDVKTIISYRLKNGQYSISGADPNATNAGTYTISLNGDGAKNAMQAELNAEYGEGNVVLGDISGDAIFEITPFEVTITTQGSAHVDPGTTTIPDGVYGLNYGNTTMPAGWTEPKVSADDFEFTGNKPTADTVSGTYTVNFKGGQAALQQLLGSNYKITYTPAKDNYIIDAKQGTETIQYVNANDSTNIVDTQTVNGNVNEEVPFTAKIPNNWKLADGETTPTQVQIKNGTIQIKVVHATEVVQPTDEHKPNGVKESDWKETFTRKITVAKPGEAAETTTQEAIYTRTVTVDKVTGKVIGHGGWQLSSNDWNKFEISEVAGYTAKISPADSNLDAVEKPDKDENIDITYNANPQSVTIKFIDTQDGNKQVGNNVVEKGVTNETISINLKLPAGYKLAEGQTLPESYKLTTDKNQVIEIKLAHETIEVSPNKPKNPDDELPSNVTPGKKYPDGNDYPEGVSKDDLQENVTRIINVTTPDGKNTPVDQVTKFERTATIDLVTGKVTYSKWEQVGENNWIKFIPNAIAGYTPKIAEVDGKIVTSDTKDETINITYTANTQSGKISYIDSDDQEVGSTDLSGKTDKDVTINPVAPAGWMIVPGQDIPETIKATANGIPTVTVEVEHATVEVTPEDPKTPQDKLPDDVTPGKDYPDGDNYPAGVSDSDLKKTVTRTIVEHLPSGDKTVKQETNFKRTATVDLVTGEVTYGTWEQVGENGWTAFTPEAILGYTASPSSVNEQAVTGDTKDTTVEITYTANSEQTPTPTPEPTPEQDTHTIIYVDGDGNKVGEQVVSGTEGTNVPFNPEYPSGWKPADSETVPDNVVIDNGTTKIVVVSDEEPAPVHPGTEPEKPENPETPESPTNPDEKPTTNEKPATNGSGSSNVIISRPKPTDEKQGASQITSTSHESGKSENQSNASQGTKQKSSEKTLPQTGEKDNSLLGMIGSLLAGLGIFGLAGDRRKKKNKD